MFAARIIRRITGVRRTLGTFTAAVFYPSSGFRSGGIARGSFPVICFGHGRGAPVPLYTSTLTHLASWGFIVIAPNNPNLFDGGDMKESLRYLKAENARPGSWLYRKVDVAHMGMTGHSMGGGGTVRGGVASDLRVSREGGYTHGMYHRTRACMQPGARLALQCSEWGRT